ncbi:MAG: TonB family protein [Pseudomonadota bacterium]
MSSSRDSAEILELDSARVRLRAAEIDPANFTSSGAYLSAIREANGISVSELSERTHIKPIYIEAIEAMDMDGMPSKPFAIGFVRSLADALGADADALVSRFKSEAGFGASSLAAADAADESGEAERTQAAANAPAGERTELSLLAVVAIIGFIAWCAMSITTPVETSTPVKLGAAGEATGGIAPQDGSSLIQERYLPTPADQQVEPSQVISQVEPVYPLACEAAAQPVETVDLLFTVSIEGRVSNERVSGSSNACFNRAALNALRQWTFQPRKVDGNLQPALNQTWRFSFEKP